MKEKIFGLLEDLYTDETRTRDEKRADFQAIASKIATLQVMLKTAPENPAEEAVRLQKEKDKEEAAARLVQDTNPTKDAA